MSTLASADPARRARTASGRRRVRDHRTRRATTSTLRTYLDRFDPTFVGLTGDLDTIVALGKPSAVAVERQKLPSGGYDVLPRTHVRGINARRRGLHRVDPGHLRRRFRLRHPPAAESEVQGLDADVPVDPEPEQRHLDLGPVPIRGYALSIILGIIVAIWIGRDAAGWRAAAVGGDRRPSRCGGSRSG
jgi:hypothetical protein